LHKTNNSMPRLIASLCFVMMFLLSVGQMADSSKILVIGQVKDEYGKPVSYAHIIENKRNEGWVSDYYGKFMASVYPGDTIEVSAISFHKSLVFVPHTITDSEYKLDVIMIQDTIQLRELVVHPWPATLSQLKRDFMKVEIDDPADDINLYLPSMKDIAAMMRTPGVPGQIGLYSGPGPLSILYDQFSKEGRSKRLYAELVKKDKADRRYNEGLITRITGLKAEDDIKKFMEFCALQVKFILESTDYELYAAILNCYDEFCKAGFSPDGPEE